MISGSPAEAAKGLDPETERRSEGDRMILVVAEQQRGKLHRASWEAVAAAQELAGDQPIEAIVLGANPAAMRQRSSARRPWPPSMSSIRRCSSRTRQTAYTDALQKAIGAAQADSRACCRTRIARATSRRSWRRGWIGRSSPTASASSAASRPTFLRPVYQGKLVAEVAAEGEQPHFVSVQIGAYRADRRSADRRRRR